MKQPTKVSGYELSDVAKEVAQAYGGEANGYHVEDEKLVVNVIEHGEEYCAELPLNQVKMFMEM